MILTRLDVKESFELCTFLRENYESMRLNDVQFAEKAAQVLGFKVMASHIKKRRALFDIPSTIVRHADVAGQQRADYLAKLEARVKQLEEQMDAMRGAPPI